jgi:sigma-B regulation protein RsbU (phosphoserine phosphatase)
VFSRTHLPWTATIAALCVVGLTVALWPRRSASLFDRLRRQPLLSAAVLVMAGVVLAVGVSVVGRAFPAGNPMRVVLAIVVLVAVLMGAVAGFFASFVALTLTTVVSLLRSYRECGVEERQQIRWPLWSIVIYTGVYALSTAVEGIVSLALGPVVAARMHTAMETVSDFLYLPLLMLIPLGFAIGILKYRLMDLDFVIRKTVVYATVTTLMLLLYLALVGGVGGWIANSLDVRSPWITVFGTLAVATLFVPARNRVQEAIDRRFYRTRYEATESLRRLGGALSESEDAAARGRAVVEELHRTLRVRGVAVLLLDANERALAPVATLGASEERAAAVRLHFDRELAAAFPARPVPARELSGALGEAARTLRAETAVPVRRGREPLGILLVGRKLSDEALDPSDLEYLSAVATQVAVAAGRTDAPEQQRELDEAREIQANLLPRDLPQPPGFALSAHWQPARQVAGDWYDALALGDGRIGLGIADVTGKGMPAALLMSNLQAAVKAFAAPERAPREVCQRLNRIMGAHLGPGRFITLVYAVLDASRRVLTYTNAGHNPPLLLRHDGTCEPLSTGGLLLGVVPEATYEEAEVRLGPGDRLLLFTDGVTEAMNPDGELFGEDRVLEVMRRCAGHGAAELQRELLAAVTIFCGGEFQDDATIVVVAAG